MTKMYLNADPEKANIENRILEEEIKNTGVNIPVFLVHDIFFAEGLVLYTNAQDKHNSLLREAKEYDFAKQDTIATQQANKRCYRAIRFASNFSLLYVDYHAYGDLVSPKSLNQTNELSQIAVDSMEQIKSDFSTHIQSKNAHGSTVIPAAGTIIIRNAEGRAQVNAPQAAEDIARLFEISKEAQERKDGDNTLANAIDGHLNDSIPHGAESDAVPETLIIRDEFGCAQVGTPQQPEDIARLFEVASEQEERRQAITQEQEERIGAVENETKERKDADKGLYDSFIEALNNASTRLADVEATPNTLVIRTSQGTAKMQAPQENDDAAPKAYTDSVQENLTAHENTTNPHGATATPTADRLAMFDGDGRLKSQHPVAKDYSSFVATTTWVRDFVFPVGCFCTQYPGEATPATKYGGTWTVQTQFYDRFARGSGNSGEAFRGAGLPNITGNVKTANEKTDYSSGAFYFSGSVAETGMGSGTWGRIYTFNANRSHWIYGNSGTVQPADYPLVIWKRTA